MSEQEYTGGKVNYYEVEVSHPTREGRDPYIAECNDIIEALGLSFAEGEAFKAIWRKGALRIKPGKRGHDGGLYDAEKARFYGTRMETIERFKIGQPVASDRHPITPNVIEPKLSVSGPHYPHMKPPADEQPLKWEAKIEPASLMDDDSPRMQAIGQNGNDGAVYSELDRLKAAADFNDDIPVSSSLEMVSKATAEAREPQRPRHLCATCAQGHATHECKAGLGGER